MKLLTIILLAIAGGIHWLRSNPNRSAKGQFMRDQPIERWGVYAVLAVVAVLVLAGCAKPPSRTVTGGSASSLNESAQTAVPPSYPPAYPQRIVAVTAPIAPPTTQPVSDPYTLLPVSMFQNGTNWTLAEFFPPIPVEPPTVLNRTTNSTSTTQPSSSTDIVVPKSWGGYWIGLCLLISAGCAVAATVTPIKRLYIVAGAAAALAALALVPPAYLGVALLITVVSLLGAVAWFAYRSGVWKVATTQVVKGVETLKREIGDPDEVGRILAVEQDQSTKNLIRKARGK